MITDPLMPLLALVAGLCSGAFYFLGLWCTVKLLPDARLPALVAFGSFLIRSAIVLAAFYVGMQGRWQNLLLCLAGFTLMRLWLVRRLKPAAVQVRTGSSC